MSHFSFYPYLFNSVYSQLQIRQNLHSLFFPPYFFPYSNLSPLISSPPLNLPLFSGQFDKLTISSQNSQIPIKNQENSGIPSLSTNINISCQNLQPKKQQTNEHSNQSLSQNEKNQQPVSNYPKPKPPKKQKIKKLSKKEKKERQMKRNLTENSKRNIIPNEIHQILSIILKKNRSMPIAEKLISKFSQKNSSVFLSVQRFYLYQSLLKEKVNHYANQESLRHLVKYLEPSFMIYCRQEQDIYIQIGLILISYFLREQGTLIILNSQRIRSTNKLEHIKTKRYLQNFIYEMIQETFHKKKVSSETQDVKSGLSSS